ncbi:hypothetical protein AGMMS49965_08930 [Bacteroidia bacterium]|nr:hypothetical protein AGMMS49965_08930 [Bacteroidia bacterium]
MKTKVILIFCVLATSFSMANKKNDNLYINSLEYEKDTIKFNSLPFDLVNYSVWRYDYDTSVTNEVKYYHYYNENLMSIYVEKWNNDTIPFDYIPIMVKQRKFDIFVVDCNLKEDENSLSIYRIITVGQGKVIDGFIPILYTHTEGVTPDAAKDSFVSSFQISENLTIELYHDYYSDEDEDKPVARTVLATYQIRDDGKIVEIENN